MSSATEDRDAIGRSAGPRAALREKLLRIVGSSVPMGLAPVAPAASGETRESHRCTLLLSSGGEALDMEGIVALIRSRHPGIELMVLERTDDLRNLPCEFGRGPLRVLTAAKSPVARAAETDWVQEPAQRPSGERSK